MGQITDLIKEYGNAIFSGAIPGLDFGPIHKLQTVANMAIREGFTAEDKAQGQRILIWKPETDAFVLITDNRGHVLLEAADAADVHGE